MTRLASHAFFGAMLTLGSAGCWVLNPSFGDAGGASAGASGTTSGASVGTSVGATGGSSVGTETGSGSASTGASGSSTGGTSGTGETSAGGTSSGTGGTSSSGTTGGLCPALAEYGNLYANDPECRACMEVQCCGELGACTGACATAANCVADEECIGGWFQCPGYSTYEANLIDTLMCIQGACFNECNIGPCAVELANCSAHPGCLATYQCTLMCPGMSGGDLLKLFSCAGGCDDLHVGGMLWGAVSQCFFNQCM